MWTYSHKKLNLYIRLYFVLEVQAGTLSVLEASAKISLLKLTVRQLATRTIEGPSVSTLVFLFPEANI